MIKSWLLGLLILFSASNFCTGQEQFTTSNGETIVNMIMGDSKLLLSSSTAVYQLDLVLNTQQVRTLSSSSRLLVADKPTGTLNGTVFVCDNHLCLLLNVNNFNDVRWQVDRQNVLLQGEGVAQGSFSLGPNSTSDITYGEPSNGNGGRRFAKGAFRNVLPSPNPSEFFRYAETQSSDNNGRLDLIKDTFTYAGFTYFTTQPKDDEIRVVRFCQRDPGFIIGSNNFRARYEIKLRCVAQDRPIIILSSSATFQETNDGPMIFLSVTSMELENTVTNQICNFDVNEINRLMSEKLESCANDMGQAGIGDVKTDCDSDFPANIIQMQINEPCELRGALLAGLEVDMDFVRETSLIQFTNAMETTTSLVVSSLDGKSFLFAGTSNGRIHQYHISDLSSNSPQSELVRILGIGATPINKMIAVDNGEYLYSVRDTQVNRLVVDRCSSYSDCESCAMSPDPVCGWCVLRGTCTRESQCVPVRDSLETPQILWIELSTSCPVITDVLPAVLFYEDLTNTLGTTPMVTIATHNIALNPSLVQFDLKCTFSFEGTGVLVTRDATASGESYSCLGPLISDVPPSQTGQELVSFEVGLTINTIDIVTAYALDLLTCSVYQSCTDCRLSGPSRCHWCVTSHICIPDKNTCQESNELTVGFNDQCHQIEPGEYFIHVDHTYATPPLRIATSNLESFRTQFNQGEFFCMLCNEGECSFPNPAQLDVSGVEVVCSGLQYNMELDTPKLQMEIQLIDNQQRQIDNPDNARVILYDCSLLGGNCGQCLAIIDDYTCSYCGGSCDLADRCTQPGYSQPQDYAVCPNPLITSISPESGPLFGGTEVTIGGTNLGAESQQITSITVGTTPCEQIEAGYEPGVGVRCRTSGVVSETSEQVVLTISIGNEQRRVESGDHQFLYLTPQLGVQELISPRSGGSEISIIGPHLDIGTSRSVFIGGLSCDVTSTTADRITCVTPPGNVGVAAIQVTIDDWAILRNGGFEYFPDPTFERITPNISFSSGGTNYTVIGTNLHTASKPRLVFYVTMEASRQKRQDEPNLLEIPSEPCLSDGTTILYCPAPPVDLGGSSTLNTKFGLLFGNALGVRNLNGTLEVNPDPQFNLLVPSEQVFGQGEAIILEITGTGFVFSVDQVSIRISPCTETTDYCECIVHNATSNSLMCSLENSNALVQGQSLEVAVHVGLLRVPVGSVRIPRSVELLYIVIPVIVAVLVVSGVILIALVAVFCRNSRQKDQKYEQLILELERLESSVARECKIGFAELQTDLDDITDIAGCRLPYRDMMTYFLATLFPGARDHPVLHPLQIPSHRVPQVHRALEDFNDLIHDKKVLMLLIRTLEAERGFNIRDKSVVGSLLVVALINRFDYATDILKSLLSDLIHKTVSRSSPKLLLRRTETVAERMLTNWLALCLHGYITEHVGQPLYLTYRAVKTQLEKGPIDVITGEARYSLSEQKLIRQKVDVSVLDVFVDSEDGQRIPVKLLDCDTVSQVKEKLLDATYKTTPVLSRPSLKSIDLVFIQSPRDQMILRDEDMSMERDGPWKKINTLHHYSIKSGALFRLVRRKEHPSPGKTYDYTGSLISSHAPRQRGLSEAEDGSRVWHLFKQLDSEDPRRSPFMNKKMVSEIYLPRMLSTKSILQKFVDDLFDSLFTTSQPPLSPTVRYTTQLSPGVQIPMGYAPGADAVPLAIKYLFDFLDSEAESAKISDPDVVHMWKNNALSLRFWVNMIKNPEFVFDINKSHTVDSCLSVIAQAFIDGCSFSDTKLNIDSPTSKLLYNKEVQGYRSRVKAYYHDIRSLPRVPEETMTHYLRQLSVYQSHATKNSGGFVVESALYELLRYCCKYSAEITGELRSAGLEAKAQSFDGIVKIFES